MIELFKNHLFQLPCELFGGPTCFCGDKIFLSNRYLLSPFLPLIMNAGCGLVRREQAWSHFPILSTGARSV